MDPQQQFKERYNSYIEQRNSQVGPASSSPPPSPKKYSPNKFYVLGVIVGLLIIAPVVSYLFLANKVSNPSSKVAENSQTSITQPSEQDIDVEMQKIWGSYYEQNKNNPKLREIAKQNLIKQRIVQQGLSQNKIQMSSIASDNPLEQAQREEDILQQNVLTSRTLDYAFVFLNPESPTYETDANKVKFSYDLLKKYIAEGKTMEQAYDLAKTDPGFFDRITITNNKVAYKNSFDKTISDKIFTYKKGQTTDIIDSGGGTFILGDITDSNDTPYATMDEWINAQK